MTAIPDKRTVSSNDYHFITHWRVEGTVEEVSAILGNARDLARWWPAVYLDTRELAPGGEDGVGARYSLLTKGWLPYTLRWQFRVTESKQPFGYTIAAEGDFVGTGIWTFEQVGQFAHITYDWKISAEKPLLRRFSFILKPIFAANHHWAMRMGEQSLRLELARLHAHTESERASIPAPPGPTKVVTMQLVAGFALAAAVAIALRRARASGLERRSG
jgi:hypothetical protein